ncbi:hypothetical protein RND81_11G222400 [Saponaria officinalis]|uniref:cyclin-dependent kinase n=1 Tax=Saponaria officinalis TaxID=3572 RepID=A0AAW1HQ66_SAPOF
MVEAEVGQLNLHEPPPSYATRSVDCFHKLDLVGHASFGEVYMAKEVMTGETVALKKLKTEDDKEGFPITAVREIKILTKLHHENVIRLKEVVTSDDKSKYCGNVYLVFEYMDHDLTGLSERPGQRFSIPQIKCYMKQLLSGLDYCHSNKVIHRDIKGANLLLDNNGSLKLGDFGLACSVSHQHKGNYTNRVITLPYRPPELLLGATKYGPAVDVWSAGCVFAELLHGKPIMSGRNEPEQLNKIFELCGSPDESVWPGVSKTPWYNNFKPAKPKRRRLREVFRYFDPDALDLLDRMLTLDPCKRISAKDALGADYFRREPLPCDPKCLPKYESSHEYQTKKRRQQQRLNEETARRKGLPHPPSFSRLPPIQNSQVRLQKSNHSVNHQPPPIPPGSSNRVHNPHLNVGLSNRHPPVRNFPHGGVQSTGVPPVQYTSQAGASSYADCPPGFSDFSRRDPNRHMDHRNQHCGWQQ